MRMFSKLALAAAVLLSLSGVAQASDWFSGPRPTYTERMTRDDMDTAVFAFNGPTIHWQVTVKENPNFSNKHSNVLELFADGSVKSVRVRFVREKKGDRWVSITVTRKNPNTGVTAAGIYVVKNGICTYAFGLFSKCEAMEARDWKEVFDAAANFAKKHGATF